MRSRTHGSSAADRYDDAERRFQALFDVTDLDGVLYRRPQLVAPFERVLGYALDRAYGASPSAARARRFLQRVLYRVNRLKLFWYDDLRHYRNERSAYLRSVRDRIEDVWQRWEISQIDTEALRAADVTAALHARAADDLNPPASESGRYFRDHAGLAGYRRLIEIASLDGLVEASQLSRTLGGVSNEVHAMLTRVLVEEYGGGRLQRKHSSFFTVMLQELGMRTEPEAYFDTVPEEVLATINHSFLLSERKRFFLRYVGGLMYTEVSVPAAFANYRDAAARLGLPEAARGYWELHIREDERHGRWMLHDVALPLAARYPEHACELLLGYDQQRLMSARAGAAVARAARHADATATQRAAA
jgi:hypothetical protein